MSDTIQTIRRSVKHFFSGTALSRISGMLRDMSMAFAFGTQPAVASFMLAFRLAHLLRRLFGEGALQSAFIPEFEALRHRNKEEAFLFFKNLYLILTLFLLILIGLIGIGVVYVFPIANLEQDHQTIIYLTTLMLPSLLFICLYGFNASLLQCEKKFFISSVAPVAFNGIWILTVLFLKVFNFQSSEAMYALAGGVILACLGQWLFTFPTICSILKNNLGTTWWKITHFDYIPILNIGKPLLLGMIGVAAFQINTAIDSLFARYADPEGPALLWYAIRLQQLPLALFGVAISGAILPPLSRAIKAANWPQYHHFLQYALRYTISFIFPITAAIFMMGDTCTHLLYGHGQFTTHSIIGTTRCLWAYGLGLFPSTLILILAPACYAQSNYALPTYSSFLTMGVNGLLNAWMIMGLNLGPMSVALATSISAWMNLFFLSYFLPLPHGSLLEPSLMIHGLKVGIMTALACMSTWLIRYYLGEPSLISLLEENFTLFPTFSFQIFSFSLQLFIFSTVFFIGYMQLKRTKQSIQLLKQD